MSQAQAIFAANFFKDKMCDLVKDIKHSVIQNGNHATNDILEIAHDKLQQKKIYGINFDNTSQIEKIFVENSLMRTQSGHIKEIPQYFSYIGINEIILDVLKNEFLKDEIGKQRFATDSGYSDWEDGTKFQILKKNDIRPLSEDCIDIYLMMYIDEIVITNPIGVHATKHKYYMLYSQILNLPKKIRSSEHSIFFMAMVNSLHIKKHGIEILLDKVVMDLDQNSLVEFDGKRYCIKLAGLCGDTLSSQECGGN